MKLEAKTKEQQDFVANKLLAFDYYFFEDTNGCGITIYMDDEYYSFDLYFDDMAEIVDYLREQNNKQRTDMETKSEMQKYIDEHIKSIAVERRGYKFHGTLTDKEERTFEFSKDVTDIERHFSNTDRTLHKDANIKEAMLLKYFQRLFVGVYAGRRQLVDLGIRETI